MIPNSNRRARNRLDAVARTHPISAEVEVIAIQKVNEAHKRLDIADVKYRFVVDMASLKAER